MNFMTEIDLIGHLSNKINAMDNRKLIIPSEVRVCATCSYWDGERRVDDEMRVVVVSDCSHGECLIKGEDRQGLQTMAHECDCMWEDLAPDDVPADVGSDVQPNSNLQ